MTSPVSHGYPDYGRFQATADKFLDVQSNVTINTGTIFGRYFVGDLQTINLLIAPNINNLRARVWFWDAPTGGELLGGFTLSVLVNTSFDGTLPVAGPWLSIEITSSAATVRLGMWLASAHNSFVNNVNSSNENVLAQFGANVNAGLTQDLITSRIWPGDAYWKFLTLSTGWELRIETLDYTGVATRLDTATGAAATRLVDALYLPMTNMRIRLLNTSVANAFYSFSLLARPLEPGK